MSPRSNPSPGTRVWACLPLRSGIHGQRSTHCMCQQTASLSSNKLHRCCARCCTPRGCTAQQQQPASAARSESRWRIDSSTFLVDEPTRQRCAVHQLATQAAATRSRRGGAIKRREKPLSFEIPAILTPGICAGRFTSCPPNSETQPLEASTCRKRPRAEKDRKCWSLICNAMEPSNDQWRK